MPPLLQKISEHLADAFRTETLLEGFEPLKGAVDTVQNFLHELKLLWVSAGSPLFDRSIRR